MAFEDYAVLRSITEQLPAVGLDVGTLRATIKVYREDGRRLTDDERVKIEDAINTILLSLRP